MSNTIFTILTLLFFIIFSYALTLLVRFYTIKYWILDIPNARSSHTRITPRGGGVAFVSLILAITIALGALKILQANLVIALAAGGLVVAVIGLWDDIRQVSPCLRELVQLIAAVWMLYWLQGMPSLNIGFMSVHLGWFGTIVAVFGIMWMINLFNFMDGSDGLAGSEAISVLAAAALFCLFRGQPDTALFYALLACAIAGFLLLNWPPAKIFMGDIGSGFLGFMFAVLAIDGEKSGTIPFIIWMLMLGVFIIDATYTLILKKRSGLRLHQAHHSHLYQLAVRSGCSHLTVTLTVIAINLVLFLLAWLLLAVPPLMLPLSLLAALLLILGHRHLRQRWGNFPTP